MNFQNRYIFSFQEKFTPFPLNFSICLPFSTVVTGKILRSSILYTNEFLSVSDKMPYCKSLLAVIKKLEIYIGLSKGKVLKYLI